MDRGVITSVTQGMAHRLASKPMTDTWPNNSKVSGARAMPTIHCSRAMRTRVGFQPRAMPLPGLGCAANSTPTATKLSQKPACSRLHGSISTTTVNTVSQTQGQGQLRAWLRSSTTTASMPMVRCAGMPQPLNSA